MKNFIFIILVLLVSACGSQAPNSDVPGADGSTSINGSNGRDGKDGVNGKNASIYVLKDANGNELPGVALDSTTRLWNESEGTITTYTCRSQVCGIQVVMFYYASSDCSGQGYFYYSNEITNAKNVIAHQGSRYLVSDVHSSLDVQSYFDTSCHPLSMLNTPVTEVSAYSGDFPITSAGPWTLEEK